MNLLSEWDAVRSLENGASLWVHSSDAGQVLWVRCRHRWGNPGRRENRRNLGWLMVHVDIGLGFNAVSQNRPISSASSCCLNSKSFQAASILKWHHSLVPLLIIKECRHICMTCFHLPILVCFSQSLYGYFQMPAVGPPSIFFFLTELCSLPPASCGQWGSLFLRNTQARYLVACSTVITFCLFMHPSHVPGMLLSDKVFAYMQCPGFDLLHSRSTKPTETTSDCFCLGWKFYEGPSLFCSILYSLFYEICLK